MLPSPPDRMPRVRTERMLIARVVTAVGLALLLVVGAWSTAHGPADVHASLCLAAGISPTDGAVAAAEPHDEVAAVDVLSSDASLCLVAALCCVALVLLLRRSSGGIRRVVGGIAQRAQQPSRAGPRAFLPALTLTQLSISRT